MTPRYPTPVEIRVAFSYVERKYIGDYSKFKINDIQAIDWEEVFIPDLDPSFMFQSFHARISAVKDKHIPVKQIGRRT